MALKLVASVVLRLDTGVSFTVFKLNRRVLDETGRESHVLAASPP
jgi:hypothetical protein